MNKFFYSIIPVLIAAILLIILIIFTVRVTEADEIMRDWKQFQKMVDAAEKGNKLQNSKSCEYHDFVTHYYKNTIVRVDNPKKDTDKCLAQRMGASLVDFLFITKHVSPEITNRVLGEFKFGRMRDIIKDAFSLQEINESNLNNSSVQFDNNLNTKIVQVTTYNPEVGQTDGSPCIGATGSNVCDMYEQGLNPIAISRDLVYGNAEYGYCSTGCFLNYGDKIKITSSEGQCNLTGIVVDTMARRMTNRIDLFKPTRDLNTSCEATISLINKQ